VAVDEGGNVYIADTNNNTIRKITPGGVVTTVAGTAGIAGSADGVGSTAAFNGPWGIAVDVNDNLYVSDSNNSTIRKITPSRQVTTLAGAPGLQGTADGTGAAARFSTPEGVTVDKTGNVFVADEYNGTIREISPGGTVSTIAGNPSFHGGEITNGVGAAATFFDLRSIAVDGNDNVFVLDSAFGWIRMVAPGGIVTTYAGDNYIGVADGPIATAQFDNPSAIAVDAGGNVYVVDGGTFPLPWEGSPVTSAMGRSATTTTGSGSHFSTIRKISTAGQVTTIAGTSSEPGGFANGTGAATLFNFPQALAIAANGSLYVADTGNNLIREVTQSGIVTTAAGTIVTAGSADGTGAAARFYGPQGVALGGDGNLYVADFNNNLIRKVTADGLVTTLAGTAGVGGSADGTGSAARFDGPDGIAVDGSGNLYVADAFNNTIRKVTTSGIVTTLAGAPNPNGGYADSTGAAAKFNGPDGVALDPAGNLFVVDSGNCVIREVAPGGTVTTIAGVPGVAGGADGTGPAARFNNPGGIAADDSGNLFVADTVNDTIRKIAPGGVVTTLAGTTGMIGSTDGTGATARFLLPVWLGVDESGTLYVADEGNDTIRKITPNGVVTTLAGTPRIVGSSDGTGAEAQFDGPGGIAVDRSGALYVADSGNDTIRLGTTILPFSVQPQSEAMNAGSTVVFTASATGAVTYQWQLDGSPLSVSPNGTTTDVISGDAGPQLAIANVTAASAGNYTCVVSDAAGTNSSMEATLSVSESSNPGTLLGLSARGFVGTGDNILIGGFYIVGNTSATVLVQAIGPALSAAAYNVSGTLQKPALAIHQNQNGKDVILYSNTGWGSSPVLLAAAAAAYALPVLQPNSPDSEVLLTLPPGGYTAEVTGADGGTGVVLCAIYQLP
jgi:sugar lactone lactonase YvrE